MLTLRLTTVAIALFPLAALTALSAPAHADTTSKLLAGLAKTAECHKPRSVHRTWCPASPSLWRTGTAAPIGPGDHVLVGVTVTLVRGQSISKALSQSVSFSALAMRRTGRRVVARITTVTPDNAAQRKMLTSAVFQVAAVLKGRARTALINKELSGYLRTLPKQATYRLAKGAQGWLMNAASATELRKVGKVWVAVERAKSGKGIFVSVFTSAH